ncbi:MAG: ABC transporter substrate-binding protein [Pseudomonadota bacterium]|nr:ABC transporter substrate-binding protein [Pseudomonadota bacterium]
MLIAAVDLVSNTCFPALAAEELGFFKEEGLDVQIELVPMLGATKALRNGSADAMIAGSVHDLLTEFKNWEGAKLTVALSQGTPWVLTVRADLEAPRGNLEPLRGLRLTAAEGPDLVFKQLLLKGGLDPQRDLEILELPGAQERHVSFGVFAAQALQDGKIDGFWSNAMGAETAVSGGFGKIHVDVRRGDDPSEIRFSTFAGLATTDKYISKEPLAIDAAVRAIVSAQKALREEPSLAQVVGEKKFPPESSALISKIVERDAEFYNPVISETAINNLNSFAQTIGHLHSPVSYDNVVATRCCKLWTGD